MTPESEGLLTLSHWTLQTFVIAVDKLVLLQSCSVNKLISTNITEMSLGPGVRLDVPGQVVLLGEHLAALLAGEPPVQLSCLV